MNQIDKEKKNEVVEKKKGLALKMSLCEEEIFYTFCEDVEMTMLAKRYKKLAFKQDQRMRIGRRNFIRDRFRNES